MGNRRSQPLAKRLSKRPPANERRDRLSFADVLSRTTRRTDEQENRKGGKRAERTVKAAIAGALPEEHDEAAGMVRRGLRWVIGLLLLPLSWLTAWTFLSQFSRATVERGFWQTAEFWYFATGVLLMSGWFVSGLLHRMFLYLYVLGHELTHAIFVVLHRGKVTDFHVSTQGGYIMTNKTNLLIALSPYFVPFWSCVVVLLHLLLRHVAGFEQDWDRALFALIGLTWTFHLVWTVWMIPRDQPDLKENGTFLSLVVIFLGNLMVLIGLFCVASQDPLASFKSFGSEWVRHAAVSSDVVLRWLDQFLLDVREYGKF